MMHFSFREIGRDLRQLRRTQARAQRVETSKHNTVSCTSRRWVNDVLNRRRHDKVGDLFRLYSTLLPSLNKRCVCSCNGAEDHQSKAGLAEAQAERTVRYDRQRHTMNTVWNVSNVALYVCVRRWAERQESKTRRIQQTGISWRWVNSVNVRSTEPIMWLRRRETREFGDDARTTGAAGANYKGEGR